MFFFSKPLIMKAESERKQIEHNFRLKRFNRLYHHFIYEERAYYKNQRIHFQPKASLIYKLFSVNLRTRYFDKDLKKL